MQLLAGKEYQRKTSGPHQMWATDASYFRVVGWGYYYMVTVMDDYSRFILAWKLQRDMTADSLIAGRRCQSASKFLLVDIALRHNPPSFSTGRLGLRRSLLVIMWVNFHSSSIEA